MTTEIILGNIISGAVGGCAVAVVGHFLTKDRENNRELENRKLRFREFLLEWRYEISAVTAGGYFGGINTQKFDARRIQLVTDAKGVRNTFADVQIFDDLILKISGLKLGTLQGQKSPQEQILEIIDAFIKFTA
jgi:hypothetical protein